MIRGRFKAHKGLTSLGQRVPGCKVQAWLRGLNTVRAAGFRVVDTPLPPDLCYRGCHHCHLRGCHRRHQHEAPSPHVLEAMVMMGNSILKQVNAIELMRLRQSDL